MSRLVATAMLLLSGCVHVPPREHASWRLSRYLEAHRELPAPIAQSLERGHVIVGMDFEQVLVVLGEPLRRHVYVGNPAVEVWLYPGYKLHQDQLRTHGATTFRAIFRGGRLADLEPI